MGKLIMIADADAELHEVLRNHLEQAGHWTISAYTGKEVLDQIEHAHADLLLLDILLPEADGWEVCHFVANHPNLRQLPIVVYTALGTSEDFFRASTYHVAGFFTKPYATAQDVLRHIDKLLSN